MNVLSLFDGMSCGRIALEKAGIKVDNYFASEIEKNAIKVSQHNFPDTVHLGSIEGWRDWDLPKIDLILAGSPCQGFSYGGKQLAFNDPRSKLYFMFEEILKEYNPDNFLLENVRMKQESIDIISQRLGVDAVKINSNLVSAQNRVRYYWSNFDIKEPENRNITLQDIIPEAKGVWIWPRGFNKGGFRERNTCPTITTSSWHLNFMWFDEDYNKYKFTAEQVEQFQNVPVGYTSPVSYAQRIKLLGNGWTVDVIAQILGGFYNDE